jgi:2-phosphosulfolactate phosphatase
MKITTYPTYAHADGSDLAGRTAVVIDLLRATSTIATALHNGCRRVIPVEDKNDALEKAKSHTGCDGVVTGGERDGVKLTGFDLGNSPLEYGRSKIAGKCLVMCTSNGTHAVKKAMAAKEVYLGCLNNADAVAKKAAQSGRDIAIVCAGTRLKFSVDDIAAAGAIISRIVKTAGPAAMDDLSRTALRLYEENKKNLHPLISGSRPYRTLMRLGAGEDIDYCLLEDILDTVPMCEGEEII